MLNNVHYTRSRTTFYLYSTILFANCLPTQIIHSNLILITIFVFHPEYILNRVTIVIQNKLCHIVWFQIKQVYLEGAHNSPV